LTLLPTHDLITQPCAVTTDLLWRALNHLVTGSWGKSESRVDHAAFG